MMGRLLRAALSAVLTCAPLFVAAQSVDQAALRGIAWLNLQVQPSGQLAGEATSVATAIQARSEAALALRAVASIPGALGQLLALDSEPATELVARRAIALLADGRDAAALIAALATRQNLDGGIGGYVAFESSVLDTSWTALALAQANQAAGVAAGRLRAYLNANVMADGGLRGQGDQQRLYNNAIGLMALQTTNDGSTAAAINSVSSWLRQRQEADGSWGRDVAMTAMVLLAIASATADTTVIGLARSHLVALQDADGSWSQDPFLTAVAARALLARAGGGDSVPLFAALKGIVVERGTNAPLAGALVELGGPASRQALTDSQGRFSIGELGAGSYGLQFSLPGFASSSGNVTLATGQTADLGLIQLSPAATTGVIRGLVRDASTDQPLAGASITLDGATSGSTLTANDGSFEFAAVVPGAITITASLAGYQSASGSAVLAGGQALLFQPKLYRVGEATPTTGRLVGSVVSAATGAALSQVTVTANGAVVAQSGADGRFDVSLSAGAYDLVYALEGHDPARQAVVLTAGSLVDAGRIALLELRTTTTIRGTVRDGGGAPIANAAVQIIGAMAETTSADGTYSLNDLPGTTFDLRISATGYNSLSARLQLAQPADVVQDFTLTGQAANQVGLQLKKVTPASATADTDVAVVAELANNSGEGASVVATLQVFDEGGDFAGKGAAYDAEGAPLSIITLAAGERRSVVLRWNTARFAPGNYSLRAQLVEPGTFNATNPNGSILAERAGDLAITGLTRFIGTVTADPPVLRAGLSQSIALSATLRNEGNTTIGPRSYLLRIINTQTNAVVATRNATAEAMPISAVQTLAFAGWTPDAGGDFRLEVASDEPAMGLAVGRAYVGDAARATFTVDRLFVPAGNQAVKGSIHVEGQDVTTGTISDPLVPLIKAAVAKAVAYTDREAAAWTSRNQCLGCHIQTHGLFGGETNRRYVTNFDSRQRDTLFNINTSRQRGNGAFYNPEHFGYRDSISRLSAWALSAWRDARETAPTQVRVANYLLTRQLGNGGWNPDYTSPATGEAAIDHTPFIVESLIRLQESLPSLPQDGVQLPQVSPHLPSFTLAGSGMLFRDAGGNLYAGIYNAGRVVQLRADGSIADQWTGLPTSVWTGIAAPDGNGLWVTTNGGIRRLLPGGVVQTVNTNGNLYYVAYGPNGVLWGVNYSANTIYQLGADGSTQVWLQSAQLNGPAGIAFEPDGSLLVLSQVSRTILRVGPDRSISTLVPASLISAPPIRILRHQGRWWVTTTESVLRFNDEWRLERHDTSRIDDLVALEDGSLLAAGWQVAGLRRIAMQSVDLAELGGRLEASIDRGTTWLSSLNLGATSDNRQLAHHLLGLGEAARHYAGTAREASLRAKMQSIGDLLKSRQRSDGGWGRYVGWGSDSYITATVGYALDYLDPSPSDPYIRKAVTWLLSRQQADGSWPSENGIFATRLGATNWVSIWLPVMLDRLGGIDTDLTITFPPNVVMSAPSIAPTGTAAAPGGGTTFRWSLIGVTNEGRTVNFDLALANMAVGEVRPVSSDARLTFRNSFTNLQQDAPIGIPEVAGSAFLGLGVGTDQREYASATPVLISAQVTNTGANLANGTVQLEVFAPDNNRIANLGRMPFTGVATGAAVNLQAYWSTGSFAAAPGYRVEGTLFDASGTRVESARSAFAILAVPPGSPTVGAAITTDKGEYAPNEPVIVSDRIRNLTPNLALDGLRAVTSVTDPSGRVVFLRSETLNQMLASSFSDLQYRVSLLGANAGRYQASLAVFDASDALLARSAAEFSVQSTGNSGQGLSGMISASPKTVKVGDRGTFTYSVTNAGNAGLSGLPLMVRVLDPARGRTLSETPFSADLAVGGWYGGSTQWIVDAPVGASLVAALYARINNSERLLAQDGFRVVAQPFRVSIGAEQSERGRVLVLLSCPLNRDGSGNDRADCVAARAGFIDTYLKDLGLASTVVNNAADFARELRSGAYDIYWITGGVQKLDHVLAGEVRQAVQRGEALLMDGIHDERNRPLDEVVGVRFTGKYNDADLPITVGSDRLPAATLGTKGVSLRLDLAGGEIDAVYSAYPSRMAAVSREYGEGAAVLFTFDWVGALMQSGADWKSTAEAAFDWIAPAPPVRVAEGALAVLRYAVANEGDAGRVDATIALPAGFSAVGTQPPATATGGSLSWSFNLDAGATAELSVWLRAPATAGSYDLTLTAKSASGTGTAFTGTTVLRVASLAQLAEEALAALAALAPTSSNERQARDRAVADVRAALDQTTSGQHPAAITALVAAEVELKRISTDEIDAALIAVARVQQIIERRASP